MIDIPIQIVDENDKVIGQASTAEAEKQGLIHRIARIMVEDRQGNILLQKRAASKSLYPNRWDNSVAGRVDANESYIEAAYREMDEEIGLKDVSLREIGYYKYEGIVERHRLNRFTRVYKVVVAPETTFNIGPEEVSEVKWFTLQEVKQLVQEQPDQLTDGVVDVVQRYY